MSRRTLITGGAGFVGTNMAQRLLADGEEVVVLDDLSRPGVRRNLKSLHEDRSGRLRVVVGDIRDSDVVRQALPGVDQIFHFAAQVAVTTSLTNPRHDFAVNLAGTVNLLEEVRRLEQPPPLLFTSTNKVYGNLDDVGLTAVAGRYEPLEAAYRRWGVNEQRALSFCSPYGCSKGGADQYVIDYAHSYGLPTVVFRMSCIYGPHQQGNEDQGWVAHFVKQALEGRTITLYGDGRQVRDVLFVEDLLDAMQLALGHVDRLPGQAFNIGGGPENTVSLLELIDLVTELTGTPPDVDFGAWRTGDQRWYVSDTRRFADATGWAPRVDVGEGLKRLYAWLDDQSRRPAALEAS
jgi:CDP-paratose 2-epimerase